MRMSCNSTYLLDPATEFGAKPDDLIAQLAEVLESRDAKAVVFRPVDALARIAGAAARSSRTSVTCFFTAACRVPNARNWWRALNRKTAAGYFPLDPTRAGVGLNLQNASAVFNMDLPWNPAVLEQRIGRVHRLGQGPAGARRQLCCPGNHRAQYARSAEVQEIAPSPARLIAGMMKSSSADQD
jgi:superfamily II DNA/RNA helicase